MDWVINWETNLNTKPPTNSTSIQKRLFIKLALVLPLLLLLVTLLSALPVYQSVSDDDDEGLQELATFILSYLAQASNPNNLADFMQQNGIDEDLDYILWNAEGEIIDRHSDYDFANLHQEGFINTAPGWDLSAWRVWYQIDDENGNRLAIGQAWSERYHIVMIILWEQTLLLLILFPLLLWLLSWSLRQAFKPLHDVTDVIKQRHPKDLSPMSYQAPSELQPLITALNSLLQQVNELMVKEQRFIADAAHELRSPLTAIKVQIELLNLTPHDDNQAHHLQTIHRVTDRATHLIEQLLTLARIDPQQKLTESTPIDWLKVSDNALQSVNLLARQKNIRLKRIIDTDDTRSVLPISGEPVLLTLLLRNLLDNAIRYSDNTGTVELIITTDHITVRDYGKGIAPRHLARVRERFFRPAGQTETGSGLGLSIVERIAELHQLRFTLNNHPDKGVEATVSK